MADARSAIGLAGRTVGLNRLAVVRSPPLGRWLGEADVGPVPAVVAALAAYFFLHATVLALLNWWFGVGVGLDEAEQLGYAPWLWIGYGGSQPPLLTWIYHAATAVLGTHVFTLKVVKNGFLFLTCLAVYLSMTRLGFRRSTAAAAALGLAAMPEMFWGAQHSRTHTIAVTAFSALTLLAFIGALQRRTAAAYALFGLAAACSVLSKYNALVFIGCLLLAALSLPRFRPAVLDRRMLLGLGVLVVLTAPTAIWNLANPQAVFSHSYKFDIGQGANPWLTVWNGLWLSVSGLFMMMLLPAALFVGSLALARTVPAGDRGVASAEEKLLWRTSLFGFAVVLALCAVAGVARVEARWIFPLVFLLPASMAAFVERLGERGRLTQHGVMAACAVIVTVAAPLSILDNLRGVGLNSMAQLDYADAYRQLSADGPVNTVVIDSPGLANLRLQDSSLRVLFPEMPGFVDLVEEPAMLVWQQKPTPNPGLVSVLAASGYGLREIRRIEVQRTVFRRGRGPQPWFMARLSKAR